MGSTLTKGTTFASGQAVTHGDLNDLVDDATIQAAGVVASHLNATTGSGVISAQAAVTAAPDPADLMLIHDVSAQVLKKIELSDLAFHLLDPQTVTQLNAASPIEGSIAYCSNGNAGAKCLAVYDSSNWKVVALGSTIATS